MDLLDFLVHFAGNTLMTIFSLFCWLKFSEVVKSKSSQIFVVLFSAFLVTLISNFFPNPIKLIITFLLLIVINYFYINIQLKLSIISVTISQLILVLSEFSFAIVVSILHSGDIQLLTKNPLIFLGLNIYIVLVSFVLHKIGITTFLYKLLSPSKSNGKNIDALLYTIIMIIIMIVATIETYMNLSFIIVVTTNTIMAVLFIGIIIMSKKLENEYQKINSKYETSISSLKEYEVMIDKFRVDTHENKNEILTIRNMIKDNNDKDVIVKYIDKLVDNKIKDNDKIMKQTAKIPAGGLRATIYSKLCLMDKLKIKYKLSISREVKTTDLINLDEELVLKICKILGVFLDNAIDAVAKLKKKEITIEFYNMEGKLCIDITNNFKGNIDIDKMSDMKYSTKGKGRGYGLTLVNKLLEEESNRLENEKSISRDTFTQSLKIKM